MDILETRVYRGPNLYGRRPLIRLRVDLGELEEYPTAELPSFVDRLLELMPTLAEHVCGLGIPGGFIRRMREGRGTWLGHVLEHVAIELQCLAGTPVSLGKTRQERLPKGQCHVVYSYTEEPVGLEAGRLALRLICHLLPCDRNAHDPAPFHYGAELERLRLLAQQHALGPTTAALVRAAEKRGIPWIRLHEDCALVQLGHGKHQHRIRGSLTCEARRIATEIASDKRLTLRILEDLGLPVLRQEGARPFDHLYRILVVNGRAVAAAERLDGRTIDKTDLIHEDNRLAAEAAVHAIGLDLAGVDFLSPDAASSYREVAGGIAGIEPAPALDLHLAPTEGAPRDVARPVIDMLFPKGAPFRIPIVAITGTHGRTATTRRVAAILKLAGFRVGAGAAGQRVLRDPRVDVAVLEASREGIVRSGLDWSEHDVGAVLDVAPHPHGGIFSLDELAKVEQVVVRASRRFCVLDADDPRAAALARHSDAEPIYVTTNVGSQLVRRHIREKKRAVVLEEGLNGPMLVLYQGEEQHLLLYARQIPAALDGPADHGVRSAMFAAAIANGLGVSAAHVREGLRAFAAVELEETAGFSFPVARAV